jgi:hypothetical protein
VPLVDIGAADPVELDLDVAVARGLHLGILDDRLHDGGARPQRRRELGVGGDASHDVIDRRRLDHADLGQGGQAPVQPIMERARRLGCNRGATGSQPLARIVLAVTRSNRASTERTPRCRRTTPHPNASPNTGPPRFDTCPTLLDRVAGVRDELLQIADGLEQATDPEPSCIALLHELLTNACSPLYNRNLPAADLHSRLARARAGIAPPSARVGDR